MLNKRAERVVLAQLRDRVRLAIRRMGVGEAERLHRSVAQGLAAAFGHHLDRQAAVEIGRVLEFAKLGLFGGQQRVDEGPVAVAVERAVDIGFGVAARAWLVVARLPPCDVEIDAVEVDDRRYGVEERERLLARRVADGFRQRRRGQRPRGDDGWTPVSGGKPATSPRSTLISGSREIAASHGGRKAVAVDRQRAARRHLMRIGGRA